MNSLDMERRRFRLSRQLPKLGAELLLLLDGDILIAEEDDTALGDYIMIHPRQPQSHTKYHKFSIRTEYGQIPDDPVAIGPIQELRQLDTLGKLRADNGRGIPFLQIVERTR
jgi:hypothetical protein